MRDEKRFENIYSQGTLSQIEVWVDKATGVNYLYHSGGYGGGLTVLMGPDGKPLISPEYVNGNQYR